MLAIKLQRIGKKHQPSYRVVVANKKSKLGGEPVEDVGSYSATTKQAFLKADRINYWLGVGAKPTVTIHNLLVKEGVLKTKSIAVKMKKAEPKAAEPVSASAAPAAGASAETAPEVSA
ncbi:MAG TPA: 30S ribosomal protein S16 [Candidatus Paceibacterota bacterium]|nr:30S ribosomal protein S16 [Candidatus Paceibacterota bacterium]